MRPGSACPSCGAAIRVSDNLPVLSFFVLRGRCRSCRWRIPWRYPAVEIATAALFLLAYLQDGLTTAGVGAMILSFLLLGLAVMDAETMRLPDAFTLPGIVLGIAYAGIAAASADRAGFRDDLTVSAPGTVARACLQAALWAICAALLIWLIRWVYYLLRHREGMGLGDAKLLAMIAAWLGPALTGLTFVLGAFAAAVFGLALVAKRRRLDGQSRPDSQSLAFGSFLCAAALYALFAGQPIVNWYAGFFR